MSNANQPPKGGANQQPHQKTQDEQNKDDEKARQKAKENLVQSWMDRLQLISVITTFFAATVSQLLSITSPGVGDDPTQQTPGMQLANAAFGGALIMESFSAVIAFMGAFVLVRYKVREATKDEKEEKHEAQQGPYSTDPHVAQTYWGKEPPLRLLERTHIVSVATAFMGFVFGAVGTLAWAWAMQTIPVGGFTSASLALCFALTAVIFVWPQSRDRKF